MFKHSICENSAITVVPLIKAHILTLLQGDCLLIVKSCQPDPDENKILFYLASVELDKTEISMVM